MIAVVGTTHAHANINNITLIINCSAQWFVLFDCVYTYEVEVGEEEEEKIDLMYYVKRDLYILIL